ncbi:MAG: ATP-binding cassette domain-containing protein [Hyphomicrobiaceae bacterium]
MTISIAAFLVQDGIIGGAIYALLAVALVLVFAVTRVVFIPQGDFAAYGALTLVAIESGRTPGSAWLLLCMGLCAGVLDLTQKRRRLTLRKCASMLILYVGLPAALLAAVLVLAPLKPGYTISFLLTLALIVPMGPFIYRLGFEAISHASVLVLLITSVGLHWLMVGLGLLFFGAEGYRSAPIVDARFSVGGIPVTAQSVIVLLTTLLLFAALHAFFARTLTGKALRASAVNRRGARLVGISTALAGRLSFALAALIGAISGMLIAPLTTLYYDSGFLMGLKGFVAAIIGGLVSFPVTVAAALFVGIVEATGVGGMTSFGQAAFVGFGAYASAVITTTFSLSPWLALPVSLGITALAACLIGLITVRLSGLYLPLGTIAWGMSFFYLFGNIQWLGGFNGISGVPPLSVAGLELYDVRAFYPVVCVAVIVSVAATQNLLRSRMGRAIRALRRGSVAAESFGVNVASTKLLVFVYAATLAGLSGWLFAHFQRAVTPTAFGLNAGIEYLLMAVVGGAGHVYGALLGAGVVIVLKDVLQDILPHLAGSAGTFETIVLGTLIMILMQGAHVGLWPMIARYLPQPIGFQPTMRETLPTRSLPSTGSPLLEVRHVCKRFGGLTAVNDVGFVVNSGEIVALLGPNGAGKSTTFDLITAVQSPDAGEIHFRGSRIDPLMSPAIAALGLARTFQHVKLSPEMSVLDNVALGTHLRGSSGPVSALMRLNQVEERRLLGEAARQLERVGLTQRIQQPAAGLALGDSRIVEIARALCLDPALLLLDEPAAGLRQFEKQDLAQLLRSLRLSGMGVLLVEHDMEFVMALADRVVVLDFGVKIAEGAPAEIRGNTAVQEAYLGGMV